MSLPKYQFHLSDVIKEKKVTQNEVTELKQWMKTANLPDISDEMISTFIVACERNLESTKKTLSSYFRIKKNSPELFEDKDIERKDLRIATSILQFGSMPVRTDDDCVVHLTRIVDYRYYNFQMDPNVKLYFMMNDITLNSGTPPKGVILITDMKGFGLMHLSKIKLKTMRTVLDFFQEAMPLNLKEVHVMNTTFVVEKFLYIVKPFIKAELFRKLHFHRSNVNMEEFHENYVPKKCLPMEYGGNLPSFDQLHQNTIERFRELKEFFDSEEELMKNYKSNQPKW